MPSKGYADEAGYVQERQRGHTMVETGLAVLLSERLGSLRGRRIGLATHPAAVPPT